MMFARAIGDPNPIYRDAEQAAASGAEASSPLRRSSRRAAQFDPDYPLRPSPVCPGTVQVASRPAGRAGAAGRAEAAVCTPSSTTPTTAISIPATSSLPRPVPVTHGSARVAGAASLSSRRCRRIPRRRGGARRDRSFRRRPYRARRRAVLAMPLSARNLAKGDSHEAVVVDKPHAHPDRPVRRGLGGLQPVAIPTRYSPRRWPVTRPCSLTACSRWG